jgi:DNA-binding response OmpR family regulator
MIAINDAERPARNLKVLVVEDEVMVGLLAEDILQALGHSVVGPIARFEKAIEAARRESVDLAMLDINLDGQEVFPVADILHSRQIPVIFVSGYGSGRLRTCDDGKPILQKPYVQEQLRTAIATFFPT